VAEYRYHLAQFNIARARAPLPDEVMADFVSQLDAINSVAEQSPGFVWRLKAEDGSSSSYIRAFEDERILINMSVWESLEALQQFVYRSGHGVAFRDRRKWFEPLTSPTIALWWARAGVLPSIADGRERLEWLTNNGPTQRAFTFNQSFPPPSESPETKT
jgi:hypothetical protein